jgi:hypothetical protein
MAHARLQANSGERFAGQVAPSSTLDLGKAHGQFHIFRERHTGDQIERLEDHSNGAQAISRKIFAGKIGEIATMNDNAARCGTIQSGDEI